MSNLNVPARALAAVLFALAVAVCWPAAAADNAQEPEAGAPQSTPADDQPAAEGFAPDEQEAAAPGGHLQTQAMCARLDELMGKGLSYAERGKAAETRAALHCPPAAPAATQAAEGMHSPQ